MALLAVMLKKIHYSGQDIGNDLHFNFIVSQKNRDFKTQFPVNKSIFFQKKILFEKEVSGDSIVLPIMGKVTEIENHLPRGFKFLDPNDVGSGSTKFKINLNRRDNQLHQFRINVKEGFKTATFTFFLEAIAKPNPANRKIRIVIDPGHGDETDHSKGKVIDPGTSHKRNGKTIKEKDLALKLAKKIKGELGNQYGYTALMTRTDDTDKNTTLEYLKWRVAFSNENSANYFISVHINSASQSNNFQVFFYKSAAGKKLATSIVDAVKVESPNFFAGKKEAIEKNYYVIRENKAVAVLIEAGNIDQEKMVKSIDSQSFYKAITKGIDDYVQSLVSK